MKEVKIWADGSCRGNPGVGGWAALIRRGRNDVTIVGKNSKTTNNQMELNAVIGALEMINDGENVTVYSDSQYVVSGITSWIKGWKKNGWISKTGMVANRPLWEKLDSLVQKYNVQFQWVRGHSNYEIDYVDGLAKKQSA